MWHNSWISEPIWTSYEHQYEPLRTSQLKLHSTAGLSHSFCIFCICLSYFDIMFCPSQMCPAGCRKPGESGCAPFAAALTVEHCWTTASKGRQLHLVILKFDQLFHCVSPKFIILVWSRMCWWFPICLVLWLDRYKIPHGGMFDYISGLWCKKCKIRQLESLE